MSSRRIHGIGMTSQRTRDRLVRRLAERGITDERVLDAMRRIPRHLFVDEALATRAYEDTALPIGNGQTISQPYVVALMTEAVMQSDPKKVLEIGTGSGYQAAILSLLVDQVFSVERIDELARQARRRFRDIGLRNIRARKDDGHDGWPSEKPFDAILITAAGAAVPEQLFEQLNEDGGVLIAPVGTGSNQRLYHYRRTGDSVERKDLGGVVFVPLLKGTL